MTKLNTKFFGVELHHINSLEDAACAIKKFCQLATADEVKEAHDELRVLAGHNRPVYDAINSIIWSLKFDLGSSAWRNRFQLLNAELK